MDISTFLNTYLGMYITQSFCHSTVALLIVERTIHTLKITDPLMRQRLRILIILSSIFSMPLYQLISPDRGSIIFRQNSLFDSSRWLNIELPGSIPLGLIFIIIMLITSLIFIFQELIPILRHAVESKTPVDIEGSLHDSYFGDLRESLRGQLPDINIIAEDDYILYSTTGEKAEVYISRGIIDTLSSRQLESVIAHEIAHIKRNKMPILMIIYLLRMIMFFNPLILIEFRRITQEEEKICDDIAVSLTKDPIALSEALEKLYSYDNTRIEDIKKLSNIKETLEEYSHSIQIESRIKRLNKGMDKDRTRQPGILIFVLLTIMVINYFVV